LNNVQRNGIDPRLASGAEPRPVISSGSAEGEHVLSLRDLLLILRRRWWVIALVAVLLVGAAVGNSWRQTPTYEASIKLLLGQQQPQEGQPFVEGAMGLQQLAQTMAEGVNSRPVAEGVVQQLNLQMSPETLLGHLTVEHVPDTQFVRVSYQDPSPEGAQEIVNTLGDVFSEQISEESPTAAPIRASVWERAVTPSAPVSPNPVRAGLVALVLGLMLGTGLAFLLEYLDDSWRSPEEAEQVSGVPNFGVIPEFRTLAAKKKGRS